MDTAKINRLIMQLKLINQHMAYSKNDPLLMESFIELVTELKVHYGSYLMDKLFDIYDDYFDDSQLCALEAYLTEDGVEVEGDEFEVPHSRICIRPFPLRIEIEGVERSFKKVLWEAA